MEEMSRKKRRKKKWAGFLGNIYTILMYTLFYIPVAVMIVFSFNDAKRNYSWEGFTTSWYKKLFSFNNTTLWDALIYSLIIAVLATVISTVIGVLGAIGLKKFEFRAKKFVNMMIYVPIIVPEIEYDLERDVISRIYEQKDTGKKHFIVIVAEGVGGSQEISHYIQHRTGIETRATILGHVQRGGSPTLRDRVMATKMGVAAVDLLAKGVGNRVIASHEGKIVDYDITEALDMPRKFNNELYEVAMKVSI